MIALGIGLGVILGVLAARSGTHFLERVMSKIDDLIAAEQAVATAVTNLETAITNAPNTGAQLDAVTTKLQGDAQRVQAAADAVSGLVPPS